MDTLEAIAARRSIRRFRPAPVERNKLTACLEAAQLAPSSSNCQPWKLVVIRDPGRRTELARAAYDQPPVRQAPAIVALLGDTRRFRKRIRRGQELREMGAVTFTDGMAAAYGEYERQTDAQAVISLNCMLAGQNLVLAATDQGLGSCWVMLFDRQAVAETLQLPKTLFPVALIALGYADESPTPRPRYALDEIACDSDLDTPWEAGREE